MWNQLDVLKRTLRTCMSFLWFLNYYILYNFYLIINKFGNVKFYSSIDSIKYYKGIHKIIINTQYSTSPCSVSQQRLCILSHQDN